MTTETKTRKRKSSLNRPLARSWKAGSKMRYPRKKTTKIRLVPTEVMSLPDGKVTTSITRYAREWKKLTAPICREFGWTVLGFDPGVHFGTGNGGFVILPLSVCRRILSLVLEVKRLRGISKEELKIAEGMAKDSAKKRVSWYGQEDDGRSALDRAAEDCMDGAGR